MAVLLGSTTEGGTSEGPKGKHCIAFRVKCEHTGTVEAIEFHTANAPQNATSVVVGILEDLAGVPHPAGAIEEHTAAEKPATNTLITVSGFSYKVTSGSYYWLFILPIGGAMKINVGSTSPRDENSLPSEVSKASEVTTWTEAATGGPMYLAGTGNEASETYSGKSSQKLGFNASISGTKRTVSTASQATALAQGRSGTKAAKAASQQQAGLAAANAGRKLAAAPQTQQLSIRQIVTGLKTIPRMLVQAASFGQATSGGAGPSEEEPPEIQEEVAGGAVQALLLIASIAGRRIAKAPMAQALTTHQANPAAKVADGTITRQVGLTQTRTGAKRAASSQTQSSSLAQGNAGARQASAQTLQSIAPSQTASGSKTTSATLAQTASFRQTSSAAETAAAAIAQSQALKASITGAKTANAARPQQTATNQATTATKRATAAAAQTTSLRQHITTELITAPISQTLSIAIRVTGAKTAISAAAQRLRLEQIYVRRTPSPGLPGRSNPTSRKAQSNPTQRTGR
jgi:hypothetical protein